MPVPSRQNDCLVLQYKKNTTIVHAILLATILPSMLLTHSNIQFALAQSANYKHHPPQHLRLALNLPRKANFTSLLISTILHFFLMREASASPYEIRNVNWLRLPLIPFHGLSVHNNLIQDALQQRKCLNDNPSLPCSPILFP